MVPSTLSHAHTNMNDIKINPSYVDVKLGDQYCTGMIFNLGKHTWAYISTVLDVEDISTRFGKPDRIVSVQIVTNNGKVIDASKKIWVSQLLQGLV